MAMRPNPPLFLGLAALSVLVLAAFWSPTPVQSDASVISAATHTVTIKYLETRGRMRRAEISVEPREGARARWRGEIAEVAVCVGPRDRNINIGVGELQEIGVGELQECTIARASMSRQGNANARMRLPESNRIVSFSIRTSDGRSFVFPRNEMAYGDDDTGDKEDPPKEDPDDPGDDGDGGDGGDDDDDGDGEEGCSGAADCVGLVNPWTCECEEEVRDPWEGERTTGESLSFGI